jgi:fibronectin-binding autotransporter adhesin
MGGGTFTVENNVTLGSRPGTTGTANGTLNLTGGTFTVGGNITTTNSANANATVTLDGGTLDMTGGAISADTFNVRSGTLSNVAQMFTGDGTTPAGIDKTTLAKLTIGGTNSYTGPTIVNDGELAVTGSITASAVQVNTGTISGTCSIGSALTIGDGLGAADAILSPGASGH